jgi:predicted Zn finger-like uncharacterized protein
MNDGIVTECPECETRFNVSDGQLKLADGKVRCGACLRVFDARAHQPYSEPAANPADNPASPAIAHTATRPGPPARQPEPQQEYSLHVRYAQPSRPEPTADATAAPAAPAANHSHAADADLSIDPDAPLEVSGAAASIDSPLTAPTAAGAPQHPEQHALAFPEPDAARLTAPSHQLPGTAMPGTAQTPAAASIPGAADTAANSRTETQKAAKEAPKVAPEAAPVATAATRHQTPAEAIAVTPAPEQPSRPSADTRSRGAPALYDLHAEPLELLHPAEPAAPGAVLGWSLGCLLAALLLASQLLWFNRIPWSQQPRLSEFYDILCHQVDCAIPPRQAVELIRNRQLVVRPHAEFQDVLSIDLLLENTANFRQPFPAIELRFSDIRGRTVAHRLLQPDDYLDVSLNPLKMAYSQPYQVNLAILDPGRRAVSYEVQLAPARL